MQDCLKNKVVYIIACGAHRAKYLSDFLTELSFYGSQIYILPTKMCCEILGDERLKVIKQNYIIKEIYSKHHSKRLPQENIVLVMPCTFNTLNKIAMGIADTYPLSIVHNALGKNVKCIIVPAMDLGLWKNFALQKNLKILQKQENIHIVYPEHIYNNKGILVKVGMAPKEKIIDSVLHCFTKIKYNNKKLGKNINVITKKHYEEFYKIGKKLVQKNYSNRDTGFLAKKIDEGILITRSGAHLGALQLKDLTLIHSWEEKNILWSGCAKPSSETPIVIEIFDKFKTKVIIHGHCKEITYNYKINKYCSDEYIKYGEWGELHKISKKLVKYNGKGIMKLHGELLLGENFKNAFKKYEQLKSYV